MVERSRSAASCASVMISLHKVYGTYFLKLIKSTKGVLSQKQENKMSQSLDKNYILLQGELNLQGKPGGSL